MEKYFANYYYSPKLDDAYFAIILEKFVPEKRVLRKMEKIP